MKRDKEGYEIDIRVEVLAIGLFLAVTIFTFILYLKTRSKKQEKAKDKSYYKGKRLFSMLKGYPWFAKVDTYLKEAGYPYGITTETYLLMHAITGVFAVLLFIQNRRMGQVIEFASFVYLFLNLIIYLKRKKRQEAIQVELCNIQDIFYFQSKIGTPQDVILAYAAKAANEPLKTPLQNLAEQYSLNKELNKLLMEFRKTTDMMEFQAFTFVLEQREKNGLSEENHHAQATMLKRAKRMRRRIQRAYKRTKLVIASVLLFACYMLFATVPLLKSVLSSLDLILR